MKIHGIFKVALSTHKNFAATNVVVVVDGEMVIFKNGSISRSKSVVAVAVSLRPGTLYSTIRSIDVFFPFARGKKRKSRIFPDNGVSRHTGRLGRLLIGSQWQRGGKICWHRGRSTLKYDYLSAAQKPPPPRTMASIFFVNFTRALQLLASLAWCLRETKFA